MPTQEQPNNSVQFINCQLKLRIGKGIDDIYVVSVRVTAADGRVSENQGAVSVGTPEVMHWLMQFLNRLQKPSDEQS
jgi:hypothetical protein